MDSTADQVHVFLRLRPTADQPGNAEDGVLEVIDDKSVSILSADEDEPIPYELDGVFDESATNAQVYEAVCGGLAQRLVAGRDCTLLTYGPLQTGKTYNLFGNICNSQRQSQKAVQGGGKKKTMPDSSSSESSDDSSSSQDSASERPKKTTKKVNNGDKGFDDFDDLDSLITGTLEGIDDVTKQDKSEAPRTEEFEGLAASLCRKVFQTLEADVADIASLGIKVSVVEIYLNRMIDLLLPQVPGDQGIFLRENPRGGATVLQGCAAISCVQPSDVIAAIKLGLQRRILSQTEPYRDSHRSTVVVQLQLEQERTREVGVSRSSVLQMVDLCASEYSIADSSSKAAKELDEKISKSILALDREVMAPSPLSTIGDRPNLVRLLSPFCRAETVTRILLTGSKLDVGACHRTLEFGMSCMQLPPVDLPLRDTLMPDDTHRDEDEQIYREKRLTELVFALSHECNKLVKNSKMPRHGSIWTAINEIQKLPHQNRPLDFYVETKREHEINAERIGMRAKLREAERKAHTHKHLMKQLESDAQLLKAQNDQLQRDLEERSAALAQAQQENLKLESRVREVEHNLRTSQFRESEAVVFLRQFRKFYYRLLRQVQGEDKSPGGSILKEIHGAPDLIQLIDLDKIMVESGLMEEEEVGKDIPKSKIYITSKQALVRSVQAADAVAAASSAQGAKGEMEPGNKKNVVQLTKETKTSSIVSRHETGEMTEARQISYQTPAGRYLSLRENDLETELLSVSEQLARVKEELSEERKTRKDLESTSAAVNKARHAKELRMLKDQLTKRSNDLKSVIYKMNEMHTVSKTLQEKVADREQHVEYLEKEIATLRMKESELLEAKEEAEKNLRLKIIGLENRVQSVPKPMWQLSEPDGTAPLPPISSRIALSFSLNCSRMHGSERKRRMSVGEEEEEDWLRNIYHPRGNASHGVVSEPSRDELLYSSKRQEASRPMKSARSETQNDGSESEEYDSNDMSSNSMSGLLFMDDEGPGETSSHNQAPVQKNGAKPRRASVYGGLVDAYNSQLAPAYEPTPDTKKNDQRDLKSNSRHRNESVSQGGKWNAPKATATKGDDDDNTPEWMKKFKTIAARNHGESVIETSGSAEARELTRTSFGETLKLSHGTENQALKITDEVKWSPKKKKEVEESENNDDNDDFAKDFLAAASSHYIDQGGMAKVNDSSDSQSVTSFQDNNSEKEVEKNSNHDSSESSQGDDSSKGKADEEIETPMLPSTMPPLAKPIAAQIPPLTKAVPTQRAKKSSYLDDSDSDSSSNSGSDDDDAPRTSAPPPTAVPVPSRKKSYLDDSESESSSKDKDAVVQKASTDAPAQPVPVAKPVPQKSSFLDDSDSGSETVSESKDDMPVSSAPNETVAKSQTTQRSFLDDSDSETESDSDTNGAPAAKADPPPSVKKSFLDDSASETESENNGNELESQQLQVTSPGPTKNKSFLDDSDSDDSSVGNDESEARQSFASPDSESEGDTERSGMDERDVPEMKIFDAAAAIKMMQAGQAEAIRSVPDHSAEVKPAIPASSTGSGKSKFVIKNGKLVKDTNEVKPEKKKPKFSIKGGKLVQTDDESMRKSSSKRTKIAKSLSDPAPESPRRMSMTGMIPSPRNKKSGSARKVTKEDEKPKQPAFTILGGKLVKATDGKTRKKKSKK